MSLATGSYLGPYQITSLLGVGGMGEVYRARDTKLGRDVAIKVLPPGFTADEARLARFRREARVLATLNHPQIGAIYGAEDAGGIYALVLELVEGPTLAERISEGPLTIDDSLGIARDIAAALEAAHAKGIVHRDLKPANIKLTPERRVKVLDFGLAKAGEGEGAGNASQSPTVTIDGTQAGMILGTAAYMSPEQARGNAVDRRTDVWAFGCVLFEMLTGRSPFGGATIPDTIAGIIGSEPKWASLPRSTPARIRVMLKNCLQKNPGKRLDNLAVARGEIDACLASPFTTPLAILESLKWTSSRPVVRWVLWAIVVAGAGATMFLSQAPDTPVPALTNPIQVTRTVGVDDHPTWSPDGATLAYESNESGNWDVWLTQVNGGRPVNRTADHPGHDRYPSWSPDGRQIAFWSSRDGGGYYVMSALGGAPERLIPTTGRDLFAHSAPEWSVDGTQLAAVTYKMDAGVLPSAEIVSLVTRETRHISLPGTEEARLDLSWSPDARLIAYVEAAQQQSELTQLRVLRLADGRSTTLTDGRTNVRRPRWSPDGGFLFYIANREGPPDLWRQAVGEDGSPLGGPERVTAGLEVRAAAFSVDGRRVAYSKGRWVSNVWRVPILENRPATWADATQVTFDQAFVEFFDVSRDGQRLTYSSDRTGNQDLWVMPVGGDPVQLTFDPAPDWSPHLSPDEREIAFYSARTGDREIWKMPASGGAATQLTHSPGLDAGSHWSPDGREIAFRSERTGNSEVWVVTSDGRATRQLTNHPASDGLASWSPDGQWLAYFSNRSGRNQIWRTRRDGGEAEVLTGSGFAPHWATNDHIYFTGFGERAGNIWRLSQKDRRERPMTNLVGRRGEPGRMACDTDGTFLYFTWRDDLGDIWVMDVVQR